MVLAISRFAIFFKLRMWFSLCGWHAVPFLILFSSLQHSVLTPWGIVKGFYCDFNIFFFCLKPENNNCVILRTLFLEKHGPRPFNPSKWTRKKYGKINKNIFPSIKCPRCLFQAVTIMSWDRKKTILDSTS